MKIKICGINDLSVLNHACDLGVDYVGFICAKLTSINYSLNKFKK